MKDLCMLDKVFNFLKEHPLINAVFSIIYFIVLFIVFASYFSFNSILALVTIILILLFNIKNRKRLWTLIWIFLLSFTIKSEYLPIFNSIITNISLTIIIIIGLGPLFKKEYELFLYEYQHEPNKKRVVWSFIIAIFTASTILIVIFLYSKKLWNFPDVITKNVNWPRFWITLFPSLWLTYSSTFNLYKLEKDSLEVITPEGLDTWLKWLVHFILGFLSLAGSIYISVAILLNSTNRFIVLLLTLILETLISICFYFILKKIENINDNEKNLLTGKNVKILPYRRKDLLIFKNFQWENNYLSGLTSNDINHWNTDDWKKLFKKNSNKATINGFTVRRINDDSFFGYVKILNINESNKHCRLSIGFQNLNNDELYMIETLNLVLNYIFKKVDMHKVSLSVNSFNTGTVSICTKVGFKLENTSKDEYCFENNWMNIDNYIIFKDDYLAQQK